MMTITRRIQEGTLHPEPKKGTFTYELIQNGTFVKMLDSIIPCATQDLYEIVHDLIYDIQQNEDRYKMILHCVLNNEKHNTDFTKFDFTKLDYSTKIVLLNYIKSDTYSPVHIIPLPH